MTNDTHWLRFVSRVLCAMKDKKLSKVLPAFIFKSDNEFNELKHSVKYLYKSIWY